MWQWRQFLARLAAQQTGQIQLVILAPLFTLAFLSLLVHAAGSIVCARNHCDEVKPRNGNDLIAAISGHEECRIALLPGLE